MDKIFLQNPWENKLLELVSEVKEELIIICPFIKEEIIKNILAFLKDKKLKILLKTNVFDISKSVFDLECLYLLNSHNTEIRTIKNLHAKTFIFDNEKAIVTSSNLTKSGLNSNVEFGILINDKEFVTNNLLPVISDYWNSAQQIDEQEIEKIKEDLNKLNDFKRYKSSNKPKITQNKHNSVYVSPKGKDIPLNAIELTTEKKREIFANRLMIGDVEKEEIKSLIEKYFKNISLKSIFANAFKYAFNSDDPLYTAGIYFKNASKVYSRMDMMVYESNVNTFKNMIMERGKTNMSIKTSEEYYWVSNEYFNSFNVDPPNSMRVFEAIQKDGRCIDQMAENIDFYFRIKDIFPFINSKRIKELKSLILDNLTKKLHYSELKLERLYNQEKNEDLIRKRKDEITDIKEKIKILNDN